MTTLNHTIGEELIHHVIDRAEALGIRIAAHRSDRQDRVGLLFEFREEIWIAWVHNVTLMETTLYCSDKADPEVYRKYKNVDDMLRIEAALARLRRQADG